MQRARAFESNRQSVPDRGVDQSAPRSTPLTLVSGALAGDDLRSVTATVAAALGCPVAIAIPALGDPVVSPVNALPARVLATITALAADIARGECPPLPASIAEAVPVRIGEEIVGIAAAGVGPETVTPAAEQRAWLEAAAAAASVTALIRDAKDPAPEDAHAALLWELAAGPTGDVPGLLTRARRLGVELGAGATAICAQRGADANGFICAELAAEHGALLAEAPGGRLLGLSPMDDGHGREADAVAAIAGCLRELGMTVALSAPRRDPATLHDAVREAELLIELSQTSGVQLAGQDETYRLLIGVLLHDPEELTQLRATTISPLADYDDRHDTDLLATLQAFLSHDGSTTETAEAMRLHRHTVGYRLSRVHEVSGLSPYESDGRERLSLGLKAHQIITAAGRRGSSGAR
jgi:hypothetical protein